MPATTLLLQRPLSGGAFEFRAGLRSSSGVDHDGIASVIAGTDPGVQRRDVEPGTLNVFAGHDIVHRVESVSGPIDRLVAVFSYTETADVEFSAAERLGFYGRT
jgi:hypothetical protein